MCMNVQIRALQWGACAFLISKGIGPAGGGRLSLGQGILLGLGR